MTDDKSRDDAHAQEALEMLAPHANEIMALLPLLANNDPAAIWELIGAGPSRISA